MDKVVTIGNDEAAQTVTASFEGNSVFNTAYF